MLQTKKLYSLIRKLGGTDASDRRAAATMLSDGDERAIYPLIRALSDTNAAVQDAAMQALIKIGGEVVAYMTIPVLRRGPAQRNAALVILRELGKVTVPFLYNLLLDKDEDIRKFALDLMGDIKTDVDIDKVLPLLRDVNPNVRAAACRTLGLLGDRSAGEHLEAALCDAEEWVVFAALEAIGKMSSEQAVNSIFRLFRSNSNVIRYAALETLGKIPSKESKDALIYCIQNLDSFNRAVAVKSLVNLGIEPDMGYIADELINMLNDDDWEEKLTAIKGLKVLKDKRVILTLIELAGSLDTSYPEEDERYRAVIDALAEIADCDSLIGILREKVSLRFRAKTLLVELIGRFKCTAATQELIDLLRGPFRDIRRGAAKSLVSIADDRCVDALIEALKDDDCHMKLQVVYALRKIGNIRAYEPVAQLLRNERCEDVIEESVQALLYLGSEDFLKDIEGYPNNIKTYVAKYGKDVQLIMRLSHDKNEGVKASALARLSSFKLSETQKRLEDALTDPSAQIRKVAVMGLGQSGSLSEALLNAIHDTDMWVRFYAIKAIANNRAPEHLADLIAALRDSEPLVVLGAIEALVKIGSIDAYNALLPMRDHHNASIRMKAEEAIQSL
ncbi:MAG: HEAT repeat domain-containing protein [Nitrospirae bacterium]|uniref:HEAT repeat domain-containing protein n=1 Tax=Candidatus Magnetobacterium casense TaxID=1455061 RepID=UPI00058DACB5|nr:HEAT repeat domain-containing protein [Candidatus Magnetobacterium casensis]MBF0338143.1 HEAT repeat domain-containing protein [Nitrospirota bacterium]